MTAPTLITAIHAVIGPAADVQLPPAPLRGSVLVLIQFDVCEEIRLDELRKIFGARTAEASFKHRLRDTSATSVLRSRNAGPAHPRQRRAP